MACFPEKVSIDDYLGFMPDLTHSEKVSYVHESYVSCKVVSLLTVAKSTSLLWTNVNTLS